MIVVRLDCIACWMQLSMWKQHPDSACWFPSVLYLTADVLLWCHRTAQHLLSGGSAGAATDMACMLWQQARQSGLCLYSRLGDWSSRLGDLSSKLGDLSSYCCRSLNSEAGVGYWTDYLKTFLHPRSLYQLPGVWQGPGRFGAFGDGKGLFGASETCDDVMDRVRYWVEECDAFQVGIPNLT